MQFFKTKFGELWNFEPKDISRYLTALRRDKPALFAIIEESMDEGSSTTKGSWRQRNAALYSVVCDTLDLSKNGKNLDFLEVVDQDNGLAIYELMQFRLADIQSSDPLARAIKIKMGIDHIKYTPQPLGVAKYFQAIEAQRTKLSDLPTPKIIDDFEVIAKAIRELPPLHEKFQAAAYVLEIQRKISKTETTLTECREAFISADTDNDIVGDLGGGKRKTKKRKLRTNTSRTDKRARQERDPTDKTEGQYNYGDCAHHPKSNTHLTCQCTNPFGLRSAFGLAVSYADKCAAVKASVKAGWSPKATNVTIPQGYGCDTLDTSGNAQPAATPSEPTPNPAQVPSQQLRTLNTTVQPPVQAIDPKDMQVYRMVQNQIRAHTNGQYHQHFSPAHPGFNVTPASPIRAYHTQSCYEPRLAQQMYHHAQAAR